MSEELKEPLIETKKEINEDPLEVCLINADLLHYYDAFSDVGATLDSLLSFDNDTFTSYVKDTFGMNDNEIDRLEEAINKLRKIGINDNIMDDDNNVKSIENIEEFCKINRLSKYINDFNDNEIDLYDLINFTENELTESVIKPFNMTPLHIKRLKQGIDLENKRQNKIELANKATESELQLEKYIDRIKKSRVGLQTVVKGGVNIGLRTVIPAATSVSTKSFTTAFQAVLNLGVAGTSLLVPFIGGLLSWGIEVIALNLAKQNLEITDREYKRLMKKSAVSNISCSSCITIGGLIGSAGGPVGCLVGTVIGLCVGLAAGYISDKIFDKYWPRKV